jgi:hydrogenase maturation protease
LTHAQRRILVGIGNPIRGDDAIGLAVAREVNAGLKDLGVEFCELSAGGLTLIERLAGYTHAVIVDATISGSRRVGECYRLDWENGAVSQRTGGQHELGIAEGLELGRRTGMKLPDFLHIYVVEVADAFTFGTQLSPSVQAAVAPAANLIRAQEYGLGK